MCYKGGPRCKNSALYLLHTAQARKQDAEQKLEVIEQRIALKRKGKDIPGGRFTLNELKAKKKELTKKIADEERKIINRQEQINISEDGIQMLRQKSEDASLSIEERAAAEVAMKDAISERKQRVFRAKGNRIVNDRLDEQMRQDGISQADIDECMVDAGTSLYPRRPSEYRARIANADRHINELKAKRQNEFDEATTDQKRTAVRTKYAKQIARQQLNKYEAERGYYSTATGLQELQDTADDKSLPLKERYRAQFKHESHQKLHDSVQNEVRLRTTRRERIVTAYAEAKKDPSDALGTLRLKDIEVSKNGKITPSRLKPVNGAVLLTKSEHEKVVSDYKASGFTGSLSQYARDKVLDQPQKKFTKKPLGILNAEAEEFTDGQPHRQRTVKEELRDQRIDFTMTRMERDTLTQRSGSFNNSKSSYFRFLVTGNDPRQIQNDRSKKNNEIKSVLMEQMTAKAKASKVA